MYERQQLQLLKQIRTFTGITAWLGMISFVIALAIGIWSINEADKVAREVRQSQRELRRSQQQLYRAILKAGEE